MIEEPARRWSGFDVLAIESLDHYGYSFHEWILRQQQADQR